MITNDRRPRPFALLRVACTSVGCGRRRSIQRGQLWTRALIAGAMVCAIASSVGSSWALAKSSKKSTKNYYILRHPKREHCKAHYARKVWTIKRRIHGHTRKVHITVCVRVRAHSAPRAPTNHLTLPSFAPPTYFPSLTPGPELEEPSAGQKKHHEREPKEPTCTTTFTGSAGNSWSSAGSWTSGLPSGLSSYGCIPAGYPNTVAFSGDAETPTEIGGVSAQNSGGIALEGGNLTLANPGQDSVIQNVKPGGTTITLDEGVTLQLAGETGALGGDVWSGPGTIEIPRGASLHTGAGCTRWGGSNESVCEEGTLTPSRGRGGLQVKNFGNIFGGGITLCRDSSALPARLENWGVMNLRQSAGFGGATECSEGGAVVNHSTGRLALAHDDGSACNVRIRFASLINEGLVSVGSCDKSEGEQVRRPVFEIDSSLSEAGELYTPGIVQIEGDYTPASSATLRLSIRQVFPRGTAETNYGTVKVADNAVLAGELDVETDRFENDPPQIGQRFQILTVGGSLSGEFRLGRDCIPTLPGDGYKSYYNLGSKGTVSLEVAPVAGC